MADNAIRTIYGTYASDSRRRLDLTYDYEHTQIRVLRRLTKLFGATHVLDIGANIGVYSVFIAELDGVDEVHSFEPTGETFAVLKENLRIQRRSARLNAHQLALSDQEGTAQFAIYGEMAGDNAIVATDPSRKDPHSVEEVEIRRLDDVVATRGMTFVAKIDVEGHELNVIAGAHQLLQGGTGLLQIECFEHNTDDLVNALSALGYERIAWLKNDHYFTNSSDVALRADAMHIIFEEVRTALKDLQGLKLHRRGAIRSAKRNLEAVSYERDPVIR